VPLHLLLLILLFLHHEDETKDIIKSHEVSDPKEQLRILQADPNSPLHSVKKFEELGLKQELLRGIYDMGFIRPSRIQEKALPLILVNPPQNLIAQAPAGTGKTAAFVLGMLSRVDVNLAMPQAMCLTPTRELAQQIHAVSLQMGKFGKQEIDLIIKESPDHRVTAQIIIGTPGKIMDLIKKQSLRLNHVMILVLDEADIMVGSQGLGQQSKQIQRMLPNVRQTLLFSATFPGDVVKFAKSFVIEPNIMQLKSGPAQVKQEVKEVVFDCGSEKNKALILSDIYPLLSGGQSIIFVSTRETARKLQEVMSKEGHQVSLLHGNEMLPSERDRVIQSFRDGETKVLITTNVMARGIDIPQVSLIVNFDLPLDEEKKPDVTTYIHRCGRTGRFGRRGLVINFVHDDSSRFYLKTIEEIHGKTIDIVKPDDFDMLENLMK